MVYIVIYNSLSYPGGVERSLKKLISHFPEAFKRKVTVVCSEPNQPKSFEYDQVKCVNLAVKRNQFLDRAFLLSRLSYSLQIYRFIKNTIKRGDVVNIHGNEYAFFPSLFKKHIPTQFRLILSTRGSLFKLYDESVVKRLPNSHLPIKIFYWFFRWYFYVIDRISFRSADLIVFTSHRNKAYFAKRFQLKRPLTVINNGFQISRAKAQHKSDNLFTAIIVGSTVFQKGLDIAVSVVREINRKQTQLSLVVVGFDDFYNHYPQNQLPEYIRYVGVVPSNKVAEWYKKSDFLLFPSRYESFGNVVIESLMEGKPFVVSQTCEHADLDYRKYGLVMESYRINDWVDTVCKMMDVTKYNYFCDNINSLSLNHYDIRKSAEEYSSILEE